MSHNKLLEKLDYYGIRGVANLLLKSYLNDRKQYVLIDNQKSSEKIIKFGIPQGSILGPLFFLIYVNDLPSCLDTVPRFFADDTGLLIDSNNTTELLQTLTNTELANINQWMTANNLVVNANKSSALNIDPNMRNNNDTLSYVLNGKTSNSAKYLGITIDNQLSFKTHISNLESKIARSVGVIAKLSYYLPHNTLLTLYYSLVHSHFLYVLPVWVSTRKTYLTKLQRLQNKALRIISKTRIRDSISQQYYEFQVLKMRICLHSKLLRLCTNLHSEKHRINLIFIFVHNECFISSYSPSSQQ